MGRRSFCNGFVALRCGGKRNQRAGGNRILLLRHRRRRARRAKCQFTNLSLGHGNGVFAHLGKGARHLCH